MKAQRLRVLLIEDNAGDANLIEEYLTDGENPFKVEKADRLAAGLAHLAGSGANGIDGILVDLGLPDSQGLDTFRKVHAQAPHLPIVVLSGRDDKPFAQEAVREGAQDYLIKGEVSRKELARALYYAVERKVAEEAVRLSEQRYKKLLESVTDYIYSVQVKDGQPVATTHGAGCVAVTGYSPHDFAGEAFLWYRMIHEEDRAMVMDRTARVLAGQDVAPFEHRIRHKDGSVRWIRNTIVLRRNERGQVISYDGLISNVTERMLATQAILDSEALYHSLVENIPLHMFRKDPQGRFTFANKRFCDALGKPLEEVVGRTDHDFYPPELADKYRRDDQKVLASGDVFESTEQNRQPNGDLKYVAVVKTPVYDAQKHIIGTQGMFWDVTETKWAQEQRMQLRVARDIQQKLLPREAPKFPNYELGGASYPAEACSGDYFDYLRLPNAVDIVVGDVSGHGFGPALLAAVTHACLRTLALSGLEIDIGVILATANRLLLQDTDSEHFVTLTFARIDLRDNTLVYSNAGHPAGLIFDGAGNVRRRLPETGPLLGVFPDGSFGTSPRIALEPGDLVIFVTDGILDAMPRDGRRFGVERMVEVVRSQHRKSAQEIVEALCRAALAYYGMATQKDDITAVAIKMQAG
jgi:sigma-B regulation protein RsbU (phosphoserine phosphatase)